MVITDIEERGPIRTVQFDPETGKIDTDSWPYLTCPIIDGKPTNPLSCMFCDSGHMTECHYPFSCEEVNCSHYQAEIDLEGHILGLQDRSGDY